MGSDPFKMKDGTPKTLEKLRDNLLRHADEFSKYPDKKKSKEYREGFKTGVQALYKIGLVLTKR